MAKKGSDHLDIPLGLEVPPPLLERVGAKVYKKILESNEIFRHQKEALEDIRKWTESADKTNMTAVVAMPTGSGKTGIISCLPYMLGSSVANGNLEIDLGKPILVLAPGLDIAQQLADNLYLRDNNTFIVKRKILEGEEIIKHFHYTVKPIDDAKTITRQILQAHDINIVNAQKGHKPGFEKYTWPDLPPELFSAIIVDEAHHLPAPQWKSIIDHFTPVAKVFFFTATPYRTDEKPITKCLAYTGLAHHLSRLDAIDARAIRATHFHKPIPCEAPQQVNARLEMTIGILPALHERLVTKNKDQPLLKGVIKHMAILIAGSIPDADEIAEYWNAEYWNTVYKHKKAVAIHNDQAKHIKERNRREVKDGDISLLVIVRMLLEGFDHPPISIAAIGTNIQSMVKFTQFIGRAQRVYRSPDGVIEMDGIEADIITSAYFKQQRRNYKLFKSEALIPTKEEPEEPED